MSRCTSLVPGDDTTGASELAPTRTGAAGDEAGTATSDRPVLDTAADTAPTRVVEDVTSTREMQERFFALSIDLLCFADFDGYFKRLSPSWEATLGFTIEELMSRPRIEFVHPDDRQRTLAQNLDVRSGGQARSFENRYLCKEGSFRWLLWNARPDFERRVIYSVARDVTARKQADAERDALVGELQAALTEVQALQDILPICSSCRRVRDDEDYWQSVESYVSRRMRTRFSHGICPSCYESEVAAVLGEPSPE